jgi:soluble lytic murein transglycosylase
MGAAIVKPDVVKRFIEEQVEANLPKKYKPQHEQIAQAIIEEATRHELDPMFLMAVIKTESNFNPEARGNHREVGLMQIKPNTAEWLARETKTQWQGLKTLRDPVMNIKLGAKYFSYLREKFDRTAGHYITAYNMGETRLSQLRSKGTKPVIYSSQVMKRYIESYNKLLASEDMPYALN